MTSWDKTTQTLQAKSSKHHENWTNEILWIPMTRNSGIWNAIWNHHGPGTGEGLNPFTAVGFGEFNVTLAATTLNQVVLETFGQLGWMFSDDKLTKINSKGNGIAVVSRTGSQLFLVYCRDILMDLNKESRTHIDSWYLKLNSYANTTRLDTPFSKIQIETPFQSKASPCEHLGQDAGCLVTGCQGRFGQFAHPGRDENAEDARFTGMKNKSEDFMTFMYQWWMKTIGKFLENISSWYLMGVLILLTRMQHSSGLLICGLDGRCHCDGYWWNSSCLLLTSNHRPQTFIGPSFHFGGENCVFHM